MRMTTTMTTMTMRCARVGFGFVSRRRVVASSRRRVVARRARWRIEGWDEGWARATRRMRIFRSARARVRVRVRVVFVVLKCTYARGGDEERD